MIIDIYDDTASTVEYLTTSDNYSVAIIDSFVQIYSNDGTHRQTY